MRRMILSVAVLTLLTAAACSEPAAPLLGPEAPAEPAAAVSSPDPMTPIPHAPGAQTTDGVSQGYSLAYRYSLGLQLPAARLIPVMEEHLAACRTAGPAVCQLISSSREGDPEGSLSGSLFLRAEPDFMQVLMARVKSDAAGAGGALRSESVAAEDLTAALVDTQARLNALTTLRNRLQGLLASRTGRLADLLEVERELSRVQGDLEAFASTLAALRQRVSMSELEVRYSLSPRPLTTRTFEPATAALSEFAHTLAASLAALIWLIAAALPWLAALGLIVWGARGLSRAPVFASFWPKKRAEPHAERKKQDPAPTGTQA